MRHLLFALLAATLVACSPGAGGAAPAASKAAHPESGLAVIPLTVTSASGVHRFKVEVAGSAMVALRGLGSGDSAKRWPLYPAPPMVNLGKRQKPR